MDTRFESLSRDLIFPQICRWSKSERMIEDSFIPAGVIHGWKAFDVPARIMDVSAK